jgi:hypothetical protein
MNVRLAAIDDVIVEYRNNSMVKTSLPSITEFTKDGVSGRPEEFKRANSFVSLALSASSHAILFAASLRCQCMRVRRRAFQVLVA